MSETQPYRLFKEFLDTIVQMPENIKKKLADEFERRRLEIQEKKSQEEPEKKSQEEPEKKSWFPSTEEKSQEEPENKSFFDSIFSKQQTDDMMDKFSKTPSTLSMALKHKCQIRPW